MIEAITCTCHRPELWCSTKFMANVHLSWCPVWDALAEANRHAYKQLAVIVCTHPRLRTFKFKFASRKAIKFSRKTIKLCPDCTEFDKRRQKVLRTITRRSTVSCGCASAWRCIHTADLNTHIAQDAVARAVKSACWMSLSRSTMLERVVPEDILTEVWIMLLDGTIVLADAALGTLCKAAFKSARHLCSSYVRYSKKTIPISRMELPQITDEESGEEGEGEVFLPWDWPTYTAPTGCGIDDTMVASLNEHFTKDMMDFLDRDERRFLARYLRKKTVHDATQRKRFERLVKRLRMEVQQIESQFV